MDDDDIWPSDGHTANYWLAEDRKVGKGQGFIMNLGCSKTLRSVSLKNTHNARHNDRSTKKFRILGSTTKNGPWQELLVAHLEDSRRQKPPPLQQLFTKSAVVSFIKFELLEFHGVGGGLQYLSFAGDFFCKCLELGNCGHQVVIKWSSSGHQVGIKWSSSGHQVVLKWSRSVSD